MTWADGPWQATAAAMYHTGWPVTPVRIVDGIGGPTAVAAPRNGTRYADFASLDLRVSREFTVRHGTLDAHIEVTNALGRRNPCCVDYEVESEDGAPLTVEREFRHWLPLVPSFGVVWKF